MKFTKMHGLGNDFIIIDARDTDISLNTDQIQKLCSRKKGIGCDQLIILINVLDADIDCEMLIYNQDGSQAEICGNATRCVAKLLHDSDLHKKQIYRIKSSKKLLISQVINSNLLSVNMGMISSQWNDIPLGSEQDCLDIHLFRKKIGSINVLERGIALNIGNPHIVFIEQNDYLFSLTSEELFQEVKDIYYSQIFPEGINLSIAIINNDILKLRVIERGAGETEACGSGACAAAYAAFISNQIQTNQIKVEFLNKSSLIISMNDESHNKYTISMTGEAETSFVGVVDL